MTPSIRPRLGLAGLGHWGPNLARVIAESDGADLTAICDLDPAKLERGGGRYPDAAAIPDFEQLLEDPDLDAVVIATPVFTHFELAGAALAAGKHVLVEKPLATSSEQAHELIALAEAGERVLMCGHTFLYSPAVRAIKELIDRGELGAIHFISSSRVNLGLHQPDVSVLWDLGPHDFSILRYWLGENPVSVSAFGRDSVLDGVHDVAFVNLAFPSGLIANLEMSWLAPSKLRRTVIVGSEKMVVYEDGGAEPVRVFNSGVELSEPASFGEFQLSYRTGDVVAPRLDTHEPLALQIEEFVEAVGHGRAPDGHAELCSDVVALIERAEGSIHDGGRVVDTQIPLGI